jgi:hypothetical protein
MFARHVRPLAADLLILAGQLTLGQPGYPHHVAVVTQAYGQNPMRPLSAPRIVQAMPSGAEEIEIGAEHWTKDYVYIRPEYSEGSPFACSSCGAVNRNTRGECKPCVRHGVVRRSQAKGRQKTLDKRWPCAQCGSSIGWTNGGGGTQKLICDTCAPDSRFRTLVRRYGVDKSMYDAMYFEQNGKCAIPICLREAKSVDHCHTTGAVRGLLCQGCNIAVGFLETPLWLEGASRYLDR